MTANMNDIDLPDHIDLEIATNAEINRYITGLNRAHQTLDERLSSELNAVVEATHRLDLAKLRVENIDKSLVTAEEIYTLKTHVIDCKRELGMVKTQLNCSKRYSSSITEYRIAALAALKARKP